ncbi:OLC1v1022655C1 [Oldenlandia corymbosa var. corymbosa]|uniref:OLC1v1022655C1 n=1 Tax=Oldenlandia corymbosa var. corymbosa TaxID=529605 RepID=A0AAV1BYA6_OLDCO|nr:OLC1v1022655C1 [Oldenlandia corymbosa var. corymbosa]
MSSANQERYNLYSPGSTGWSILKNEEFQEEDIWGVLRKTNQSYSSFDSHNREESSSTKSKHLPSSASKKIPKPTNREPTKMAQHSAPVNIPDWSKIYGIRSKKPSQNASSWLDYDDHGENEFDGVINSWDSDQDDEEEDDDENLIPPHEWIAKKLARSQISSFSVCEGVGRTLKGRDLSNVRNAVLTRTGFLE